MKRYYFLGIGGISMSTLAIMLKEQGNIVSGSDDNKSRATQMLQEQGFEIDFKFNKTHIRQADIVVFSSAIKTNNPQFEYAKKLKKKLLSRGEILGEIASGYENVIAIAGSHGKTTTTGLIYQILAVAGKNPTLHLGGFKLDDGKNYHLGEKKFFVTEACEYHDNFLHLYPFVAVVTNVEKEHLDYFKTFENQKHSFEIFKKQSRIVVDNFGNLTAKHIKHDKSGGLIFDLFEKDKKLMHLHLHICEEVNTQNCIYAYQVAKILGIEDCIIKLGLESFLGIGTRFEKVKCPYFENVICDYAHHPTEISKAIQTAQKIFQDKTLVTIFQPHTYSRTQSLFEDFVKTFKGQKLPLFYKTYSARERPKEGMSAKEFVEKFQKINKNAHYFDNFKNLKTFLLSLDRKNCVLLFLGAGDLPTILNKNKFIS